MTTESSFCAQRYRHSALGPDTVCNSTGSRSACPAALARIRLSGLLQNRAPGPPQSHPVYLSFPLLGTDRLGASALQPRAGWVEFAAPGGGGGGGSEWVLGSFGAGLWGGCG